MTIAFENSFKYVFKDPQWVSKLAVASLFSFLTFFLIGIPFLNGYVVRIIRWRLQDKDGLPSWEDLGGMFVDGLKIMLISLGYALPILMMAMGMLVVSLVLGQNEDLAPLIILLFLPFQGLLMLYSLAMVLIQPWTFYTVASGQPLSSAYHLKPYFKAIKQDWTNPILAILFIWVASSLASFGLFVFLIGLFIALGYVMMVMGDIYGRLLGHWKTQGWIV